MMRVLEAATFLGIATALHVGVWTLGAGPDGATSSGSIGQQQVSIAAATQAQSAMVAQWTRPPDTATKLARLPNAPVVAGTLAPRLPQSTLQPPAANRSVAAMETPKVASLPEIDTTTPKPPAPMEETREAVRPKPRPASLTAQPSEAPRDVARQKQTAKGNANHSQQGTKGRSDLNSTAAAATNALRAQWGSAIYAQVRRHMRYPRGTTQSGTAKLALQIASNGKLSDLRLTRSSGNAELDRAALRAVSRAGRFAKAPKGLSGDSHKFSLSLTFSR